MAHHGRAQQSRRALPGLANGGFMLCVLVLAVSTLVDSFSVAALRPLRSPLPLLAACRISALQMVAPNVEEDEGDDTCAATQELAGLLAARREAEQSNIVTEPDALLNAGTVWALLFNPGSDDEGIYSRRLGETGQNMILTFEEEDDAERT